LAAGVEGMLELSGGYGGNIGIFCKVLLDSEDWSDVTEFKD
jgi:hypothetical protein